VSDNGKQFDSAEFRQFCNALNIRSTTSSPEYPRSNGLVERMVQTVKESFIKSQSEGKTLLDTLQVLRSTPLGNGLPTPAVILQRRNLRGGLLLTPNS
jgi:transposase InsO family protein